MSIFCFLYFFLG